MTPSEFSLNVLEFSFKNNGGTFDVYKQEVCDYNTGFFVSLNGSEKKTSSLTQEIIEDFIFFFKLEEIGDGLLGVWYNEEDSLWYLDISYWYKKEKTAYNWSLRNNQLAYWDCENNREIRI